MMKRTGKRILAVVLAALFTLGSVGFSAASEHEHAYTAEVQTEPGYVCGGTMLYRCSCGDSYTQPIPQRTQPYAVVSGGFAVPGDPVTVEVCLQYCSGLVDLTLDLWYNEQVMQLTQATCAEYGAPEILTPKALRFDAVDPDAQEAILLLTFSVAENAPNGKQAVSVSGCGVSACAVDGGEEIILTSPGAELQIYRSPRLSVTAPDAPVYAGETVQMTVDIVNNPGIAGMALALHYDTQALTLTAVQAEGMFAQGSVMMGGDLTAMPYRVLWDDAESLTAHTEDGAILTLTFTVKASAAAGTANVWVEFGTDDVLDINLEPVELTAYAGAVTIVRRTPGDADSDGEVDLADVTNISRWFAGGWDVQIDTRNSDVNGDGVINLKDVALIRRYLAGGWNVELI